MMLRIDNRVGSFYELFLHNFHSQLEFFFFFVLDDNCHQFVS